MKTSDTGSSYRNPSRSSCEQIIKKILTRELEAYGANRHFKQASDFMVYFESLYPASPSLTRQVQRAVNSMHLPHDKDGYFMLNKTAEEYDAELELSRMLRLSKIVNLEICTPVLLKTESWQRKSVIHLLESISDLRVHFETLAETDNGILIYTKDPEKLTACLSDFIEGTSKS